MGVNRLVQVFAPESGDKQYPVADEKEIELVILSKVSELDLQDLLANQNFDIADIPVIVEDFVIFVNIYCSLGKRFDVEYVKGEFKSLGLKLFSVHKLYHLLDGLRRK